MSASIFARPADAAERAAVMARIRVQCEARQGDAGCWLWRGAWSGHANASGSRPMVSFRLKTVPVRHVVYFLREGIPPPPGLCICACGLRDCVAPACVRAATRAQAAQIAARMGVYSHPDANARRRVANRARAHYGDAVVAQVRSLPGTVREAARATGMSAAYVADIRAGRARAPMGAPPPPPRRPRISGVQSRIRRAAARAALRARSRHMACLQSARAVAGIWAGLLQ